jgi:soluble lytic murein transglycosylase-like protein
MTDQLGGHITSGRTRRFLRRHLRLGILTSIALAVPHHSIDSSLDAPARPRVSATIDSMVAVTPEQAYDAMIREAASRYDVDATLIRSVMQTESRFDPWAVSRAGAMGLMQLTPAVIQAFGVDHPFDPRENILAGARLLRELLDRHDGNVGLAIASYNAGPAAVSVYGGIPPFGETQLFVRKVTGLIADARRSANDD